MHGDMHMKRFRIQDCILRLTEKNKSVPVAGFNLYFRLDELPFATVTPAFGSPLFGAGDWASLSDLQEKEAVDLILKVNDVQTLLLSGYISQIVTNFKSTLVAERQSLSIKVSHRAVKLAGYPSTSFIFSGFTNQSLNTLAEYKASTNPFIATAALEGGTSTWGPEAVHDWLIKQGQGLGYFPGHAMKIITKELFKTFNDKQVSQKDLEKMIRTYNPANLTHVLSNPAAYIRYLAEHYAGVWRNGNSWQALKSTARKLNLNIIPFNTGFYIANPYTLNHNHFKTIKAREYVQIGPTTIGVDTGEHIDGIILEAPISLGDGLGEFFSFPDFSEGAEPTTNNKYYHREKFPVWLQPEMAKLNGALTENTAFSPPTTLEFPNGDPTLVEYYKSVGGNLARSMYGQIRQSQAAVSKLYFPYRLDLMPGTNIQFDNSDTGLSFIGDTTYGMVLATTLSCDTFSASPMLRTIVDVTALRNAKDNADEKLTIKGHPLFQEQWVGINLLGDFLTKPPDVKGPGEGNPGMYSPVEGKNKKLPSLDPEWIGTGGSPVGDETGTEEVEGIA
jgi:hypothetical protein